MENKHLTYNLYDDKITLTFDDKKHWYFANGEYVPSVTGVTKYLDKSGPLMGWAVKTVLGWLQEQLKPGEVVGELQLHKLFEEAKKKHREYKEDAATIGGLIHKWIQGYIEFQLGATDKEPEKPIDEAIKNGVKAFLHWEQENKLKYLFAEKKIFSKKYNYAGTCDLIAELNGKLSVIDFKTGSGPWYEHAIQISAYRQALQEELKMKIKERWILKVDKETGKFHAHKATLHKEDFKCFLALLEIYRRHRLGILTKEKPYNQYCLLYTSPSPRD